MLKRGMELMANKPLRISIIASLVAHGLLFLLTGISFLDEMKEIKEPYGILVEIRPYSKDAVGIQVKSTPVKNTQFISKKLYHDATEAHAHHNHEQETTSNIIGNAVIGAQTGIAGNENGTLTSLSDHYINDLRLLLEQRKIYPQTAKMLEQEGTVVVGFTINIDGSILDIHIEKPSKFSKLNEAALKLIENIKKFHPIPSELKKEKWSISVPIEYRLE